MVGGAYLATMERARGLRLPAEFYDTSTNAYLTWLLKFSERASQIKVFGQSTEKSADAFEVAIKAAKGDRDTRAYIKQVSDAIYRRHPKPTSGDKKVLRGTSLVGIGYLSGAFTAIRDLVSGVVLAGEQFGALNTTKEAT